MDKIIGRQILREQGFTLDDLIESGREERGKIVEEKYGIPNTSRISRFKRAHRRCYFIEGSARDLITVSKETAHW